MGSNVSTCKDTQLGNFFVNNEITTLKPMYIICYKKSDLQYPTNPAIFIISDSVNDNMDNYDFVIKLKPGISFFIDDIIKYHNIDDDTFNYDYYVTFLHNLTIDDIFEFTKIPKNISNLKKIYDVNNEIFNMDNMNKLSKISTNSLIFRKNIIFEDYLKQYKNIYNYADEHNDELIVKQINDDAYKNIIFLDRKKNYKLSSLKIFIHILVGLICIFILWILFTNKYIFSWHF